jgi:molecular chaperone GrpE (heat shock protein)
VERERGDAWTRAQGDLAGRLLDTLDDLERVSAHADTSTPDALLQGVQLVERKLRQVLEAAGLEPVDAEGARSTRTRWKPLPWSRPSRRTRMTW